MSLVSTDRVHKSCDGHKHQPLGIQLQGVLVGSLDAVKHLVLLAVHCGILQTIVRVSKSEAQHDASKHATQR